jgi:conjugative transfer signal peptidase TraF
MRRRQVILAAGLGLAAVALAPLAARSPWLIWNASASAPIGLYRLERTTTPSTGERVAWRPTPGWSRWLASRGYLPEGALLLKPLAATAPSQVCRRRDLILIDGRPAARARPADTAGRPLPSWSGCITLDAGTAFLLASDVPDSLDSRYFGPVDRRDILGRVTPIRTREAGR